MRHGTEQIGAGWQAVTGGRARKVDGKRETCLLRDLTGQILGKPDQKASTSVIEKGRERSKGCGRKVC